MKLSYYVIQLIGCKKKAYLDLKLLWNAISKKKVDKSRPVEALVVYQS